MWVWARHSLSIFKCISCEHFYFQLLFLIFFFNECPYFSLLTLFEILWWILEREGLSLQDLWVWIRRDHCQCCFCDESDQLPVQCLGPRQELLFLLDILLLTDPRSSCVWHLTDSYQLLSFICCLFPHGLTFPHTVSVPSKSYHVFLTVEVFLLAIQSSATLVFFFFSFGIPNPKDSILCEKGYVAVTWQVIGYCGIIPLHPG